ncbi:DUF262 domain-containing protein [Tropicimonas sp. TH_r6]|uniref:GmrSD restriction endonuclease domain-containing protein n=1 Tax=Tropicimonas sp. TH_r6 TaxID=3082085 RepID=UPI0029553983|nr:DUF262 domain-containing protein [Tropicimonas sp. TH_r6]MDV7144754.1 DUF262 domain-containing protein [Tropicimonas sp. TH_r6]
MNNQPKPDSKTYHDLISEIKKGIIKVPKFQRDFVWDIWKTAGLLDSILKGYPIGTFILWETDQRINEVKNIGNLDLPETPTGQNVQYVLDGQQRITSLFAAFLGAKIQKVGERKLTDYKDIVVNLSDDLDESEDRIITVKGEADVSVSLHDVLHFDYAMSKRLSENGLSDSQINKIDQYSKSFSTYAFSTVTLRKSDINSAIDVFTRINTGGKILTLFEIMSAKTYDEAAGFDMQVRWTEFQQRLNDRQYENIAPSVILQLLSLRLSETKECKRKTILMLDKADILEAWEAGLSAIEQVVDYFRTVLRIPVSQLLPYDTLIVPFAYFFMANGESPNGRQRRFLEELFWRSAFSFRYSSAAESRLAADIRRVDKIIEGERPSYHDVRLFIDSPDAVRETNFSAGNAACKAILCILAYQEPKDFHNNARVLLDNSYLKIASSKNYHHFFPKAFLKKSNAPQGNSISNITLVSADLNKNRIRAKAPSFYLVEFHEDNSDLKSTLATHLIDIDHASVIQDDYAAFLKHRSEVLYEEIAKRIDPPATAPEGDPVHELILEGEGQLIEFKSSMRYDMRTGEVNKKLEYVIAKTVAAFMNSDGGKLLIGVDDHRNSLGLKRDYSTLKKADRDGFQLHLSNILDKYLGREVMKLWNLSFPTYDNKQICQVSVRPSNRPVFVTFEGKESFFVRKEGSSQPLNRAEQHEWSKDRW